MNVLFICTGNTFRSATAHHTLVSYCGKYGLNDINVKSAGIVAKPASMTEVTLKALSEVGVDATKHVQTKLDEDLIEWADLVVAMDKSHKSFIKEQFDEMSVLFHECIDGKSFDVSDDCDFVDIFKNDSADAEFQKNTVEWIYSVMPYFVEYIQRKVIL